MEIVAHTLWATAAAKAANRKIAKIGLVWFAIWTMLPDLFAFSPEVIAGLSNRTTGSASAHVLDFRHVGARWGWLEVDLYDIGHSLVIFVAAFLFLWAILRRPVWEMSGWALHILLDIPSHSAHYPTPFLWPLSSYYLVGVSWRQWWFTALNYSILAVLFLALWIDHIRRQRAPTAISHAAPLSDCSLTCGGAPSPAIPPGKTNG